MTIFETIAYVGMIPLLIICIVLMVMTYRSNINVDNLHMKLLDAHNNIILLRRLLKDDKEDLAICLLKEWDDGNWNMTVDEFYDKHNVPKNLRFDFGVAAMLKQAHDLKKARDG